MCHHSRGLKILDQFFYSLELIDGGGNQKVLGVFVRLKLGLDRPTGKTIGPLKQLV